MQFDPAAQPKLVASRLTVSESEAMDSVRNLLVWAGDDPEREGLADTPHRVARAFLEYFSGYQTDPHEILTTTFEEIEGYHEMVTLQGISFCSFCEHHMLPFTGVAHIGYIPSARVVGISKLARVVDAYARRLQIQEKMTAQIANAIADVLAPRGVGVVVQASHSCMAIRGVRKPGASMTTRHFTGVLRDDASMRREFLDQVAL